MGGRAANKEGKPTAYFDMHGTIVGRFEPEIHDRQVWKELGFRLTKRSSEENRKRYIERYAELLLKDPLSQRNEDVAKAIKDWKRLGGNVVVWTSDKRVAPRILKERGLIGYVDTITTPTGDYYFDNGEFAGRFIPNRVRDKAEMLDVLDLKPDLVVSDTIGDLVTVWKSGAETALFLRREDSTPTSKERSGISLQKTVKRLKPRFEVATTTSLKFADAKDLMQLVRMAKTPSREQRPRQ